MLLTIVIVGLVPTAFDRDPDYYRKELVLKMSCSYGPGRYDPVYEEQGFDYPAGFVRWTENRNMQAFQHLLHEGHLDLTYLTTHRYSLEQSPAAYDLILGKTEPYLGILIEYDHARDLGGHRQEISPARKIGVLPAVPGVSFIGAGSYALSHLLPNLPEAKSVARRGVATATGTSARSVAERYNFTFCAADAAEVLADQATTAVFVATRHDSHAKYVQSALRAGKHVFVEKPLALDAAELAMLREEVRVSDRMLMVGFNRRFAPLIQDIKKAFGSGPMSVIYRINAGAIPRESWIQDPRTGGGRIVGEVCHFIDTLVFLTGSSIDRIYAVAMPGPAQMADTVVINLQFRNGSIGSICYFANGPKRMPKEYLEVFKDGQCAVITDYKELVFHGAARGKRRKLFSQDKGQAEMVRQFLGAVRTGGPSPIPFAELDVVTEAAFGVLQSLREAVAVGLGENRNGITE